LKDRNLALLFGQLLGGGHGCAEAELGGEIGGLGLEPI
jgi:hypothetical protein